jgi:lysophospholipid acyltransferase (LPLAT)-like uncharacterized protein
LAVSKKPSFLKRTKRRLLNFLAAALGPFLLKSLGASWRTRRFGYEHMKSRGPKGQHPVIAVWHESIPTGTVLHRHHSLAALTSLHRDGRMISNIMERLGFITVQGSSRKGGGQALRELLSIGKDSFCLVITPDGPRGPAYSIAPGTLFIAAMLGRPVIAYGYACNKMWRANSWDRMVFPKPFCKLAVGFSEPFFVPREALRDKDLMADYQKKLMESFESAHSQAKSLLNKERSSNEQ